MAKDPIEKLEKTLKKLAKSQDEIAARLGRIEAKLEANGTSAPDCEEVIRFLDGFRAGEALGEASLGAWIEVCTTPCLKGGLRTVQCREGMHARLLEARMKELGGSPEHEIPEAIYNAAMVGSASTEKSDAEKVLEFVSRFPDIDEALRPIHEMADRLDDDQETQSLLRTIAQDERSTLEFLAEACALLNG
jgi:DNA-binding ferritin-like protein